MATRRTLGISITSSDPLHHAYPKRDIPNKVVPCISLTAADHIELMMKDAKDG